MAASNGSLTPLQRQAMRGLAQISALRGNTNLAEQLCVRLLSPAEVLPAEQPVQAPPPGPVVLRAPPGWRPASASSGAAGACGALGAWGLRLAAL